MLKASGFNQHKISDKSDELNKTKMQVICSLLKQIKRNIKSNKYFMK